MDSHQLMSVFTGKRIAVTGITGFKGNWLMHMLTQLGAVVGGYSLPPAHDAVMGQEALARIVALTIGDITDPVHFNEFMDTFRPDVLIHLAAQPLVRLAYLRPAETITTNIMGTLNVLEAARSSRSLQALLVVTSDKCYANVEQVWGYRECDPMGGRDPYSASKGCCEILFHAYMSSYFKGTIRSATARAGNVIGGGDMAQDRIIPDMIREFRGNRPIILRNPEATRPWQHVLDVVYGYLLLVGKLLEGTAEDGPYNFGPDHAHSATVLDLATMFSQRLGMGKIVVSEDPEAPHEAQLLHLDSSKSRVSLGWEPRMDLRESIDATAKWYQGYLSGISPEELTGWQTRAYLGLSSQVQ